MRNADPRARGIADISSCVMDCSGWMTATADLWKLGADSATVIALRAARIAGGGAAGRAEAALMVTEKLRAVVEVETRMMTGAFGWTPLSVTQHLLTHYRGKVAANRRRLSGAR